VTSKLRKEFKRSISEKSPMQRACPVTCVNGFSRRDCAAGLILIGRKAGKPDGCLGKDDGENTSPLPGGANGALAN
jgi:hypothetical protein